MLSPCPLPAGSVWGAIRPQMAGDQIWQMLNGAEPTGCKMGTVEQEKWVIASVLDVLGYLSKIDLERMRKGVTGGASFYQR